jgi:hypothetical protein
MEISGTRGQVIINGKVMTPVNGRVSVGNTSADQGLPQDRTTLGESVQPEVNFKSMLGISRGGIQSKSGVIDRGVVVQDVVGGKVTTGAEGGVTIDFR